MLELKKAIQRKENEICCKQMSTKNKKVKTRGNIEMKNAAIEIY